MVLRQFQFTELMRPKRGKLTNREHSWQQVISCYVIKLTTF